MSQVNQQFSGVSWASKPAADLAVGDRIFWRGALCSVAIVRSVTHGKVDDDRAVTFGIAWSSTLDYADHESQLTWHANVPVDVAVYSSTAAPFTAVQCPICQVWVDTRRGPWAECDVTKPMADYEHMQTEHADRLDLDADALGIPYFTWNDKPVEIHS